MLSLQQSECFPDVKNPPKEWGNTAATRMSTVMMAPEWAYIWTGFTTDPHGGVKQKSPKVTGSPISHSALFRHLKRNQIWQNGSPLFNQGGRRSTSAFIISAPIGMSEIGGDQCLRKEYQLGFITVCLNNH